MPTKTTTPKVTTEAQDAKAKAERKRIAQATAAADALNDLANTVVQREWMAITRALDLSRADIGDDNNLTLLALLWVKRTREDGYADWTELLEMTDQQLRDAHGFPGNDDSAGTDPAGDDKN